DGDTIKCGRRSADCGARTRSGPRSLASELRLRIRGLRRPSSDGGKVDIAAQRPADVAAFPATQDAVDDLEVGSTARFDDVGTGAVAAERLSIVCDYDSRLSLRVLAAGGTVKVEALQDRVDVRREFQRAEYGFRGAVSRGGLVYLLAAIADRSEEHT